MNIEDYITCSSLEDANGPGYLLTVTIKDTNEKILETFISIGDK